MVVPRNVRDSRFRREPYRKRKRASTYISPIHAERPTNDAVRVRVKEGCGGGGRWAREGECGERCAAKKRGERKKKKKKWRKKKKRGKKGKSGPRATTYLCSAYYQLWDTSLVGGKRKNEKHGSAHARARFRVRMNTAYSLARSLVYARIACTITYIHGIQDYILINACVQDCSYTCGIVCK